jgi:long-chain acyl-CoA synthetase
MSERLFAALAALPDAQIVLSEPGRTLTAAALRLDIEQLAQRFQMHHARIVAVLADNSATWVVADLAAMHAGVVHLPLPGFFSDSQLRHALEQTAADLLLTDQAARCIELDAGFNALGQWYGLTLLQREIAPAALPAGTAKISFTSGSSGQPKGVCLSAVGLVDTAAALCSSLADVAISRHLAVLPLALLLENVAGVYAPLLRGATIMLPKMAELGWRGMGGFDPLQLQRQVGEIQPDSVILVPELLKAWALALRALRQRAPASLKFVAVGGARCDIGLLEAAREVGLPVYEGYGMTECGSVVCLNRPSINQASSNRPGSVGQPLPHVRLRVDADNEIHIESRAFLGYLGVPSPASGPYASGDLGHLDADGFLHLSGRRGNLIITAYGRNIAPEWIEAALLAQPEIAQAVVVGEARASLSALLVPQQADTDLTAAVARVNAGLPDYARIGGWLACAPFSPRNGLATGNGRPIRAAILRQYDAALESLYSAKEPAKEPADVVL